MSTEYTRRINRVQDYIEENIASDFTLEELAGMAAFSKYHFHRIFHAMTGETVFQFIQRLRLERAGYQLLANRGKTVTEIALDSGFSGSASFAKAFKSCFGMSASEWRARYPETADSNSGKTLSNPGKTDGNSGKAAGPESGYTADIQTNYIRSANMPQNKSKSDLSCNKAEVKSFPETTVAYVRHVGPYQGNEDLFAGLYEKLFTWAGPRDLIGEDPETLVIYHDNPEITDDHKLRVSVCLGVPEDTEVSGEVGKMTVPEGKYVFANFVVDATQFGEAWNWVYGEWLPNSGYEPDDRPCFEYYRAGKDDETGRFNVDICVPVRPV